MEIFYSNLTRNLFAEPPKPPTRYENTITFFSDYYEKFALFGNFKLNSTKWSLHRQKSKTKGIDQILGKFLKDGAWILLKSISELCNLFMILRSFPDTCEITKVKKIFKKGSRTNPSDYKPNLWSISTPFVI